MTGVHNLRPPKPKLDFIWDVSIVFRHIECPDNTVLSDKLLTHKLLILLLLLGGQRMNTIKSFHIDRMFLTDISVTFCPANVLKHSRKSKKMDTFLYRAYINPNLCVVSCLREYLLRRNQRVNEEETQLFITYGKPYKAASIDTMRRWIKELFADVNIVNYTPHSCRAASTSKASNINIDIENILKLGCWKNEKTFRLYYEKEIISKDIIDFNKIMEK